MGGTFLAIAATDLLPEVLRCDVGRRDRTEAIAGFVLGVLVIGVQATW